jgi:5-methylcytosine-specific restriction endonuclease McrA
MRHFDFLWQVQHGRCFYCGERMAQPGTKRAKANPMTAATFDHVMPKALGGRKRKKKNTVLACYHCNQQKRDMHPREWVRQHGEPRLIHSFSVSMLVKFGF